jgi:hypothetical protein
MKNLIVDVPLQPKTTLPEVDLHPLDNSGPLH